MKKAKSQFLILMVTIACVLYICKLNNRTPFENIIQMMSQNFFLKNRQMVI